MEKEIFRERLQSSIIDPLKTLATNEEFQQILQESIDIIIEKEERLNQSDYDSQRERFLRLLERIRGFLEVLDPSSQILVPQNPLSRNPYRLTILLELPPQEGKNNLPQLLSLSLVAMKPNRIRFEPAAPFTNEIQLGIPKQENNRVHPTKIPLGIGIRFRRRNKKPVQHFFTFEIRNGRFKTIHQINIHLPPDIQIQLEALGRTLRKVIETVYFPQSL